MDKIAYIKIENFKTLNESMIIELQQPSVLIGPNNSGKTSVLQAMALWHHGLTTWWAIEEKKSVKSTKNVGVAVNRLLITQAPVKEIRHYFKNTNAKTGTELKINVGLRRNGQTEDCGFVFVYQGTEVIYCKPDERTYQNLDLIAYAAKLEVKILYPMSGMAQEEAFVAKGFIDVLIGQGKTAEVLRNLCYKIHENDNEHKTKDWEKVTKLMLQLFQAKLNAPLFNAPRGTVELTYSSAEIKNSLDIALAGRGQQEMLLLIAYLMTHKNSVLLLDEPDAHLELLRQRQVFALLKHLASETQSQLIIATHSEVILKETEEDSLVFLIGGEVVQAQQPLKAIKNALGTFALEHFYKARTKKTIFFVEGNTDIEMLRAFAEKTNHPALAILDSNINQYYTSDIRPENNLETDLHRAAGYFLNIKTHFQTLKTAVPELQALGIFDSDGSNRLDEIEAQNGLAIVFWKRYEIENYFVTPDLIRRFLEKDTRGTLFAKETSDWIDMAIRGELLDWMFNGNSEALAQFESLGLALQKETFKNNLINRKASLFLEKVIARFSELNRKPIALRKADFYKMIDQMPKNEVEKEVLEKLDLIAKYLV